MSAAKTIFNILAAAGCASVELAERDVWSSLIQAIGGRVWAERS
jgi:hypothetical protein